jgi:hypothetical protein
MRNSIRSPLAILLAFILIQAQAMALGPGVPYGGVAGGSIQGIYTGVFIPGTGEINPFEPIDPNLLIGTNSLGVFALEADPSGEVEGTAIFFIGGVSYNAVIQGLSLTGKGQLFGVLDLKSTFQVVTFVGTPPQPIAFILVGSGRMVASSGVTGSSSKNVFASLGGILTGNARVTADTRDDGDEDTVDEVTVDFIVDGIRGGQTTAQVPTLQLEETTPGF